MRALLVVVPLLVVSSLARADDPAPPPTETAPAPLIITGRVTDVLGHPVGNARVHVVARTGERQQVTTDADGRYKAQVTDPGTYGLLVAVGRAQAFRTVIVGAGQDNVHDLQIEVDAHGGEVITIQDKKRPLPKVKAKSQNDPMRTLPYSEEAKERDAWARAWLLLDVDETGHVTRLKLLKRPGFDLDRIAIDEGFKLKFDPALDGQDRATKTYVLWMLEWPSQTYLVKSGGVAGFHGGGIGANPIISANPAQQYAAVPGTTMMARRMDKVPCVGQAPLDLDRHNRAYRDCSKPDIASAERLPWITRETAAAAVAELERAERNLAQQPTVKRSKVPAIVATGVTGGLVVGLVLSYMRYSEETRTLSDPGFRISHDLKTYQAHVESRGNWRNATLGFGVAAVLSTGASVLLWSRSQSERSFSVQPTSDRGAAVSYGGSF